MTPSRFSPSVLRQALAAKRPANRYDVMEVAGAFGDLGTLIPFVVGYIAVLKMDPAGVLVAFGLCKVAVGLFYRTPMPVQPMKAIGATAISQAGAIPPSAVYTSSLVTAAIWLFLGLTGTIDRVAHWVAKPVVRGIVLGLGFSFIIEAFEMMRSDPIIAAAGLVVTYLLLTSNRFPAMFVLLLLGIGVTLVQQPDLGPRLAQTTLHLRLPSPCLTDIAWSDVVVGAFILALPQVPLSLGNACIATVRENNSLFPDRPVTVRRVATTMGLMNILSPLAGGVPMCHGAGGMAGHVRFGARTGGALVILGAILLFLGLFMADSVELIFALFPTAVLGVILFFAGTELALSARDAESGKEDFYVMVVTAGFATWNMGVAFLAGILLHAALKRGVVKV